MKDIFKEVEDIFKKHLATLRDYDPWKLMLVLVLIWLLIYIPAAVSNSYGQRDERYEFYPEKAAPWDHTNEKYNVTTRPVSLENTSTDRLSIYVEKGSTLDFNWTAFDYDNPHYIGRVNVYYELDGEEGLVRLKGVHRNGSTRSWAAEKKFKQNGTLRYYYRLERNDISVFHRRTSVLLEGMNIYEEVKTGPPPLIHLYFIPPTLLTMSPKFGGAYLSFSLYFSLFLLFDGLLLFSTFHRSDRSKAFLMSLLFLANPVTISNVHQDEAIVVFTMLLPLLHMVKNKDKLSSIFAGLSIPVKVWGGFIFPLYLLKKKYSIKKRFFYILSGVSVSLSVFLFFYYLWGAKSVWFISQYAGTTQALVLGPLSFWGRWWGVLPMNSPYPPRAPILLFVVILESIILYLAYKRDWPPLMAMASFLSIFFGLYIKVHWAYYIILFPFILYFSVRDKRLFTAFVIAVLTIYLMMIFASASFYVPKLIMALLNTAVVFLLLYHVYLFMTDEKFLEMEKREIWGKGGSDS